MLSISPIRDSDRDRGVRYYIDVVANSRDDYYAGRGEAAGHWHGGGAAALGLAGRVEPAQYLAVMYGMTPDGTGWLLERAQDRTVLGWDLTFSAPKSLSLLWTVGDATTRDAVRRAHDEAVAETLAWLESEVARARRGHGGKVFHDVDGVVAAAFRHRSSRAGDPQLHTHVVVANAVRSIEDGRWTGLDSRGFYSLVATGSAVYQSALRAKLAPLGLRWAVRDYGLGEVADIDPRVLRAFSTQRQRIEAELAERGLSSPAAANVVAHRVRPAKDRRAASAPDEELHARWRAQLEALEIDGRRVQIADVTGALGQDRSGPTSPAQLTDVVAELSGVGSPSGLRRPCRLLTARASTLTRAQVMRALATAVDLQPAEVARAFDEQLLARPEVVSVLAAPGKASRPEARRYTTADLLAIEEALANGALARQDQRCGRVAPEVIEAVEAARPELGDDQRAVLRRLLSSGDGVEVIVGPAGTGKTYLLEAARDGWQRAGYRVIGASLAALAAAQLEAGSAIPATTVHRLLEDLANPDGGGLDRNTVIVIDEAAMVGSRTLARLAHHADRAKGKLVLLGDHKQLPEIDAGGGFRLLVERLGAAHLTENRRQDKAWERHALAQLRDGSVPAAVTAYVDAGRITIAPTAAATRSAMIEGWWRLCQAGDDPAQVLLIAPTRAEAESLGAEAQTRLLDAGLLGPPAATTPAGIIYQGDRVVATKNLWRLDVRNGDKGTVIGSTNDGGLQVVFDRSGEITLPEWYVTDRLRQAYALTAHRAQGATLDHILLLGTDTLYRELGYSALSRGRLTNSIFLTGSMQLSWFDRDDPIAALTEQLGLSRAEQPATNALPDLVDLGDATQARAEAAERDYLALTVMAHQPPLGRPAEDVALARSAWQAAQARRADLEAHGAAEPTITQARSTEAAARDHLATTAEQARAQDKEHRRWLAEHRVEVARHRELADKLGMRGQLLAQAVRWQQPHWASELLGPLPTSRRGETAWLSAGGAVAAYRERWCIDSPEFGPEPPPGPQRTEWRGAQATIDQLRHPALSSSSPPDQPQSRSAGPVRDLP
jgi:conjugative relaxase-like TrwC/TraI family protein